VTIGAHGYRHVPLSTIPENARIQELTDARNWLEDVIQLPVSTMSYPFGDTPFDIANALKVAG
jgi:peptidoglycan/xylan/chitin deacetylase (PgdA/CDA1 family)